jgi:diguanylate cyclase (GGDEF)-like protein
VLIEAGQRMSHLLRDSDLLARLGGDEFAIVLPRQKSLDALRALGERLIQAIARPYRLDQDNTRISASIGAAVLEPGMTLEMALHNADMAIYRMKHGGGNGFALFEDDTRSTHPGA